MQGWRQRRRRQQSQCKGNFGYNVATGEFEDLVKCRRGGPDEGHRTRSKRGLERRHAVP